MADELSIPIKRHVLLAAVLPANARSADRIDSPKEQPMS
jgi:hypothetical protein